MILGNKCDMEDKRQVPKEKGETVSQTRVHKETLKDYHHSNFLPLNLAEH